MPKKYLYCKVCKNEIEKPSRNPFTTSEKVIWGMICVGTIGVAAIVLVIYYVFFRAKNHCPDCHSKVEYTDKPLAKEKKREDMTPREKVLNKAGQEIEDEEEPEKIETQKKTEEKKKKKVKEEKEKQKIFCSFCGEELKKEYPTCPFCQTALKF